MRDAYRAVTLPASLITRGARLGAGTAGPSHAQLSGRHQAGELARSLAVGAPGSERSAGASPSARSADRCRCGVDALQVGQHAGDDRRGGRSGRARPGRRRRRRRSAGDAAAGSRRRRAGGRRGTGRRTRRGSTWSRSRKCPGMPTPASGTPSRRPTSMVSDRQRDRDAEPPVEHLVEERVARVVVVVLVAARTRLARTGGRRARRAWAPGRPRPGRRVGRGSAATSSPGRAWAAISKAASSRGTAWRPGRRSERARTRSVASMAATVPSATVRRPMYPGDFAPHATPTSRPSIMAGSGAGHDLRRARRRGQPAVASCFARAGLRPGDHVAFCIENHPRFFEVAWGAHYAGLVLHRHQLPPHRRGAGLHRQRLRRPGVHHLARTRPSRPPSSSPRRPSVELRADARRRRRRLRVATRTPSPRSRPSRSPTASRASTCSTRSGTTGRPKGVKAAAARRAARHRPTAGHDARARCCSASTDDTRVPVARAAVPRGAAALQHGRAPVGGTVVVMEHFDPEESLALIERYRVTHSQWVPTMFIRMLKLPDEVRARYDLSSLRGGGPRRRAVPGAGEASR